MSLLRKNAAFWRQFLTSMIIVLVCGIIAISIPVIVNRARKQTPTPPADTPNKTDTTEPEPDTDTGSELNPEPAPLLLQARYHAHHLLDQNQYVWEILVTRADQVVTTWSEIYQNATDLHFDATIFQITRDGLLYTGDPRLLPDLTSDVSYQNLSVKIKYPIA